MMPWPVVLETRELRFRPDSAAADYSGITFTAKASHGENDMNRLLKGFIVAASLSALASPWAAHARPGDHDRRASEYGPSELIKVHARGHRDRHRRDKHWSGRHHRGHGHHHTHRHHRYRDGHYRDHHRHGKRDRHAYRHHRYYDGPRYYFRFDYYDD